MKQSHEITIRAPLQKVFAAASDVVRWPEFLPHYRFNRFLSHKASGGVVKMSCGRSGVVATWVTEYRIDPQAQQLHFHHLKSTLNATRGMKVRWDFEELDDHSTHLSIHFEMQRKLPLIAPTATDWLLGKYFFQYVATQTLAGFKRKLEAQAHIQALALPSGGS